MEFLDKLKRKPKHVRQRIALVTSGSISLLIFFMWWTTFNVPSDTSQTSLGEALSPVSALAGMVHNAVDGAGTFSEDLKSKVMQIQYEATGSPSELNTATASASMNAQPPSTQDIVYPEQIFDKSPPPDTNMPESASGIHGSENNDASNQQINP